MRGNSGFLRWPHTSSSSSITSRTLFAGCVLVVAVSSVIAGPLNVRPRRMIRDVYSEFESQSQNVTQPTAGTCLHDGIAVPDTSVQCEKKSGCRAIQKTGYCCPDYQCDCERNGKIYANGEKLVDPEEPCKGCYCQGGEILCNKVNCYIRHDCEPKFIAGRCCPEYDNCPPIDSSRPMLMSTTMTTPQVASSSIPESREVTSSTSTPSTISKQQEMANSNPLGIKIKEITKPEEIRIIDEKPKQTYQILKPVDSSASSQPKVYPPNESRVETVQPPAPPVVLVSTNGNQLAGTSVEVNDGRISANSPAPITFSDLGDSAESAPAMTANLVESSTESANKLESAEVNSITDEDAQKIVRQTDSLPMDQIIVDNVSSTTEADTVDKVSPETVGKEVVIVDSNGQTKPITVFGVEGLQRGDVVDEAMEFEERKTASKRSDKPHVNIESTTELPMDHSTGSELIYENTSSSGQTNYADIKTVSEIDPIGSSSDDFVRIVVTSKPTDATTEGAMIDSHLSTSSDGEVFETVYHPSGEGDEDIEDSQPHGSVFHTVYREPDQSAALSSSTDGPKVVAMDSIDDDGIIEEPNPAYPTIMDDLSVYQSQVSGDEEESSMKDEKILPDVLDLISNATHSENSTTLAPESWLKHEMNSSSTEGVLIDDESALIPQERSPGEPLLIPEWERNATETTTPNATSLDSLEEESLFTSGEPTEIETSPASGDGPSRLMKERESTTQNARKIIDIDEDGSGRPEHNPKDDIESLKYQDDSDPTYEKPYLLSGFQSMASVFDEFIKTV